MQPFRQPQHLEYGTRARVHRKDQRELRGDFIERGENTPQDVRDGVGRAMDSNQSVAARLRAELVEDRLRCRVSPVAQTRVNTRRSGRENALSRDALAE